MPKNTKIKTTFTAVDKSSRVIKGLQGKMMRMTASASMGMRKLNRVMGKATSTVTAGLKTGFYAMAGAATAAGGAVWALMKQFSKVEDAEAAFTPLLGIS